MMSLSAIHLEIAAIANESSDPVATRLAKVMAELCTFMEEVDHQSRNAFDEARRAKHDADRALRQSKK